MNRQFDGCLKNSQFSDVNFAQTPTANHEKRSKKQGSFYSEVARCGLRLA